jgi:hypothetical protein
MRQPKDKTMPDRSNKSKPNSASTAALSTVSAAHRIRQKTRWDISPKAIATITPISGEQLDLFGAEK